MIGHNVDDGVAAQELGDPAIKFRYMPLHIGDWFLGNSGLTFEHRGFYIDFLARLYDRGKPFIDNDREMADIFDISIRVWRRLKEVLIKAGKILVRNGALTNERFEKERRRRADEMRRKSEAAQARWRNSKEISGKIAGNLDEISTKISPKSEVDTSKIKELAEILHQPPLIVNRNRSKEEENPGASESVAAAEPLLPQIEGFNGATTLMVTKIAKWMNPNAPAYAEARQWLVNTAQIYGNEVVRDAFAAMEAKAASGDIVGRPLVFMTKTCQGKKRDLDEQKQQKQDMAGLQNMSEAARKKILADRERAKKGENMLWT